MLDRPELTTDQVDSDLKILSSAKTLDELKLHRDKYHAHFDRKHFFEKYQLHELAPLPWDDVLSLPVIAMDILDGYTVYFDGSTNALNFVGIDDVNNLLDILHRHNEIQSAE
jgi:hypothetical protein